MDNTPAAIKAVLQKPGIYMLHGRPGIIFIEIDASETVHQLTLRDFQRDGILDKEGWMPEHSFRLYKLELQNAH